MAAYALATLFWLGQSASNAITVGRCGVMLVRIPERVEVNLAGPQRAISSALVIVNDLLSSSCTIYVFDPGAPGDAHHIVINR